MQIKFKKISHLLIALSIVTSFIFSSPSTVVKDRLTQVAIDAIQASNQVAFAQEIQQQSSTNNQTYLPIQSTYTAVCCNNYTPNADAGEYCDATTCQATPVCCENYTPKTDLGEYCNNEAMCSDGGGDPNYVCCDATALNDASGAVMSGGTGQNGEPFACGNSKTYCSYKDPDPTPICCDTSKGGKFPPGKDEFCGTPAEDYCASGPKVCCDGNWTNYVLPSDRPSNATCDYQPPTCACTEHTDPFTTQARTTTSNCPGDGTVIVATSTATTTTLCQVSTSFSVTKSMIDISGTASMVVPLIVELASTTQSTCDMVLDDTSFLAGRAAADATPETPLNTTIVLDAFTTYVVTSKDYCPNINGIQNSFTECTEIVTPSCGSATLYPTDNAPTDNLCTVGTPGTITTNINSYNWSCVTVDATVSCSVERTCNGTTCVEQDYCLNISGIQDINYAGANNMYTDGDTNCWNNVTGACGNATQVAAPTGGPTNNLCLPYSSVDSSPTLNTTIDPNKWQWTCKNSNGNPVNPPAVCETTQSTSTSALIKTLKIQPSIVSSVNSTCNLTWETEIDNNTDSDVPVAPVVCTLNGNTTYKGNTIYDDNLTGLLVSPGSYAFSCTDGLSNTQTKSVKCSVKPDFKEI